MGIGITSWYNYHKLGGYIFHADTMKRTFLVGSQRLLEPLLGDPAEFQLWTARATVDCGLSQRRQQNARPLKLYSTPRHEHTGVQRFHALVLPAAAARPKHTLNVPDPVVEGCSARCIPCPGTSTRGCTRSLNTQHHCPLFCLVPYLH